MNSAPPVTIITPAAIDNQHAEEIASNLKALGHQVEAHQIVGITDQTPLPKTQELQDVGAEITGEDLTHLVATTVAMQPNAVRTTNSSNPLRMFMNKLLKKKGTGQDIVEK